MEQELKRKTTITDYRNPDTDSICSAICYADLKQTITGDTYIPARAGHMNGEIRFILDYFGVEGSRLVKDVRTQVKDIEIRKTRGVADNISLKKAWNIMQESNVVTIPSVRPGRTPGGLITVGGITKTYTNIYGNNILSKAHTQYSNITETLEVDIVVGNVDIYFDRGKVLIAATDPDLMEFYIEPHDLVTLGNRYESQLCAIEVRADCIIVCEGADVLMTTKKVAQDKGCIIIATTYDTHMAARLINQSTPISYFMTRKHLITFSNDDYTDEIREAMVNKRHRDFPILGKEGRCLGMISRRNPLGAKGKQATLVDHNEKSQAVAGIESAKTMEIIDHYRLGTIQTVIPVFFYNQPLGCTATTIYQMYLENKARIEPKIAGLLCSAIVSDALLLRSPTCISIDEMTARLLTATAELDIEKYVVEMFGAGGNPKDKSDEGILYQNFKKLSVSRALIGVGQIASLDDIELGIPKEKMLGYIEKAGENSSLSMVFFVLTNILKESTGSICYGQGAVQLAIRAFRLDIEETAEKPEPVPSLPGAVPRKKQLIPELMLAEQNQTQQGQED